MNLGTDSGAIVLWDIPEGGVTENLEEPTKSISAHADKIYSLQVSIFGHYSSVSLSRIAMFCCVFLFRIIIVLLRNVAVQSYLTNLLSQKLVGSVNGGIYVRSSYSVSPP